MFLFLRSLFPFDAVSVAAAALWAIALYFALAPVTRRLSQQLAHWLGEADRSLYTSTTEYERSREARESVNLLYASIISTPPLLVLGGVCDWGVEVSLGHSWGLSLGMVASIACGVYALGRQSTEQP